HATRILISLFRGALKLVVDAISVRFARRQVISFTGAGQRIRGWFYYPRQSGEAPGVLLLPTAMGLTPHEHAFAARLAREGYTALVIAYTNRTTGGAVFDKYLRTKELEQEEIKRWGNLPAKPMV